MCLSPHGAHTSIVFTRAKSFDRWITSKEDLYAVRIVTIFEQLLSYRYMSINLTKVEKRQAKNFSRPNGHSSYASSACGLRS